MSNSIPTKDNEATHLIIYCLKCIRHGRNATYEPGLSVKFVAHKLTPVEKRFSFEYADQFFNINIQVVIARKAKANGVYLKVVLWLLLSRETWRVSIVSMGNRPLCHSGIRSLARGDLDKRES